MRLGVIGINHKLADLKLRELLAQICQRRFNLMRSISPGHGLVLLSTCNRTEIYFSSEDLAATHTYILEQLRQDVQQEFDQKIYTFFGRDCFSHLARVAAGLDSAILAETEIQGQVRAAYEVSMQHASLPEELHFLFQKALKIGKQIRTDLPMGRGVPDLQDAVLTTVSSFFANPSHSSILYIGASEINLKILTFFQRRGLAHITLCNRTDGKATAIAEKMDIQMLPWQHLSRWHQYDCVICGTKAPGTLLETVQLPSAISGRKLLIDLSVPRNISPQLSLHPQVTLFNIDQINRQLSTRRRTLADQLAQAEKLVSETSQRQILLFQSRDQARQKRLAIGA